MNELKIYSTNLLNKIDFLGIIITFVLVILFCKLSDFLFNKISKKNNSIQVKFSKSIIKSIIIILGIVNVLSNIKTMKNFSTVLLQSTGLLVAVLGFAAQSVLSDVISGIMLSISKPFNIGEKITVKSSDISGIVENITIRHTIIKCFDGTRVIIPNSVINKELIINSNLDELIGNYFTIDISYHSDIRKAIKIMYNVIINHPLVLDSNKGNSDKNLTISVSSLNDSSITLKTTIWTKNLDDNFKACSDLRILLK